MAIGTDIVARKYLNPVAATPISVDIPASDKTTISVLMGESAEVAVQDTDYTVTLNTSTYEDFTITPTESMRTKIDALVVLGDTDQIVVRRTLNNLSDMTAELAFFRQKIATEFDKTIMRFQQFAEKLGRCVTRADSDVDATGSLVLPYSGNLAGKALVFDASENLTISVDDYENQAANAAASALAAAASENAASAAAANAATSETNSHNSELAAAASAAAAASFVVSAAMTPVCSAATTFAATQILMNGNTASVALGYTAASNLSALTANTNSYIQTIVRNTNAGTTASSDIVVNNNMSTDATYYGDFGMNSSGFTGTGNLNKANAVYLSATTADLVIGTTTANAIHFVYNGGSTDSAFIDATGFNATSIKLNGSPVINKVVVQKFTSSGTYTRTAGMVYCVIETWGGGGGGGGTSIPSGNAGGGGGGGAGGYSRHLATATDIGVSQVITIGAGGAAGAAGYNSGGAGGTTSVGSLVIANGGAGGAGSTSGGLQGGAGGAGGAAGTGNIVNAAGASGGAGYGGNLTTIIGLAGGGGNSMVGGGGAGFGLAGALAGNNASGYGAGGSGASGYNGGLNVAGGAGSAGLVIVTEFLSV